MSRRQPERRCFPCGATFPTTTALGIHLASCPALSAGPVTREVHCWACASPIDLRAGRTCPTCGREYEGRITVPDANPELSRMYAVADDHEADVLDDLQHRAGIVWTHRVEEGPGVHTWTNPVGQPCEVCGKDQAAAEEDDET